MTNSIIKVVVILATWTTSIISTNSVRTFRASLPEDGSVTDTNYIELVTNTTKHVTTGWIDYGDCEICHMLQEGGATNVLEPDKVIP